MAFSYTPGGATDLDDVRAAIGDTDSNAPGAERLEDEEIERFLVLRGGAAAATVAAAKALIAKLSRRATEKTTSALRLVYTQRIESLWRLCRDLETTAAGTTMPYLGGASVSDRASIESDTDRVEPAFRRGMLDNPRAE